MTTGTRMWPRLEEEKEEGSLMESSLEACVGIRMLIQFARSANQDISPNDGKN